MKVTLEKVNSEKATLSLEIDGKTYKETWVKEEDGSYSTSESVIDKLKRENVEVEEELEEYLKSLNVSAFVDLCEMY